MNADLIWNKISLKHGQKLENSIYSLQIKNLKIYLLSTAIDENKVLGCKTKEGSIKKEDYL